MYILQTMYAQILKKKKAVHDEVLPKVHAPLRIRASLPKPSSESLRKHVITTHKTLMPPRQSTRSAAP